MRLVTALLFLCSFFACTEAGKQQVAEDLPIATNDTFDADYINELKSYNLKPTLSGFTFDTVSLFLKKSKTDENLIIPRLTEKKDLTIDKKLRKGILEIVNSFRKTNDNFLIDEDSREIIEGTINLYPINVFRNNSLISYCFEICYSDSILMRPYCNYESLNYDVKKNKFIRASDFFDIRSSEDSLYIKKLILSAVREEWPMFSFDDKLDFSMNDEYIFFYFDAYELSAPFDIGGGIKKKYLARFIKEEYK
ncbi:hypothetical protein [Ferruginibacter sp.]|nr:hypothetical protein [Ferruginibacter sp.]